MASVNYFEPAEIGLGAAAPAAPKIAPFTPGPLPERRYFAEGIEAGVEGLKSAGYGAVALGARGLGFENVEAAALKRSREAAETAGAMTPRVQDVNTVGDAWNFAKFGLGNALPSMGTTLLAAISGGGAARLLTRNAMRESTKQFAQTVGAVAGGMGASSVLEAGSIFPEALDTGVEDPALRAAAGGVAAGSLDALGPLMIARRFGVLGRQAANSGVVGQGGVRGAAQTAGLDMLKMAATEVPTEVAQEVIARGAAGKPVGDDEALSDYANVAALTLPTAILGGPGGAYRGFRGPQAEVAPPQDQPAATAPQETPQEAPQPAVATAPAPAVAPAAPVAPEAAPAPAPTTVTVNPPGTVFSNRDQVFAERESIASTIAALQNKAAWDARKKELSDRLQALMAEQKAPKEERRPIQQIRAEIKQVKERGKELAADLKSVPDQIKLLQARQADTESALALMGDGSFESQAPLQNAIAERDALTGRIAEIQSMLDVVRGTDGKPGIKPEFAGTSEAELKKLGAEQEEAKTRLAQINSQLALVPEIRPAAPGGSEQALYLPQDLSPPAVPQANDLAVAPKAYVDRSRERAELRKAKSAEIDKAYEQLNAAQQKKKARELRLLIAQARDQNVAAAQEQTVVDEAVARASGNPESAMAAALRRAGLAPVQEVTPAAPAPELPPPPPPPADLAARMRMYDVWKMLKAGETKDITDEELSQAVERGPASVKKPALKELMLRLEEDLIFGDRDAGTVRSNQEVPAETGQVAQGGEVDRGRDVQQESQAGGEADDAVLREQNERLRRQIQKLTPRNDPLIKWIVARGGIDSKYAEDITGEKAFNANKYVPGLFKSPKFSLSGQQMSGWGLDEIAIAAGADGEAFLTWDENTDTGGVKALTAAIQRAINREGRNVRFGDEQQEFQALQANKEWTEAQREAEKLGVDLSQAETLEDAWDMIDRAAQIKAMATGPLSAQFAEDEDYAARAALIDEDAVERAAIMFEGDTDAFMAEIRRIVDEADAEAAGQDGQAAQQAQTASPGSPSQGRGGAQEQAAGGASQVESPDLAALAYEARAKRAAAEADVAERFAADGIVIGTDKNRPGWRNVLTADTEDPAKVRVTSFDGDEPIGHRVYNNTGDASIEFRGLTIEGSTIRDGVEQRYRGQPDLFTAPDVQPVGQQADIFNTPVPQTPQEAIQRMTAPAPQIAPANVKLATVVEPMTTGELKIGIETVKSPGDAAHVLASLRKSAQERFVILALDAEKRPIAVLRLNQGGVTAASIYPDVVAGAVYQTPGVRSIWYSHNHPSGTAVASAADESLTRNLSRLFGKDTGVTVEGHVIIAGDKWRAIDASGRNMGGAEKIPAFARKFSVPVKERMFKRAGSFDMTEITGPKMAMQSVKTYLDGKSGVLALDARNRVVGVLEMGSPEMAKLRSGPGGNAAMLFGSLGRANAVGAIIVTAGDGPADVAAAHNVARALKVADIRSLDVIQAGTSWASSGAKPGAGSGDFHSVSALDVADNVLATRAEIGKEIASVIDRMIGGQTDLEIRTFTQRDPEGFVGRYRATPYKDVIEIAMNAEAPLSVAAHEGFHYVESRLLSKQEREVLNRGLRRGSALYKRVKDVAAQYDASRGTDISTSIDAHPMEAHAYAYQFWTEGQLTPTTAMERVFQKLRQVFEKIRNWVDGYGFQSTEELFDAVNRGVYAKQGRAFMVDANELYGMIDQEASASDGGRDPAAEEATIVENGISGKDPIAAAEWLAQNAPGNDQKMIAQKVKEQLERLRNSGLNLSLNVAHIGDSVPRALVGARGLAIAEFGQGKSSMSVWLNGADVTGKVGVSYETLLHELVHAATMSAVRLGNFKKAAGTKVAKDVADLYDVTNAIIRHFNERVKGGVEKLTDFEREMYAGANNAFRSPNETIAWALSSRDAQRYLESIQYKGKSLWTKLVEAVRTFLGLPAAADTALSEVLRISDSLLDANVQDLSGVAASVQQSLQISGAPDQTQTPAFQKWFGDSKVVDAQGKPLVVMHASTYGDITQFDRAEQRFGKAGFGFYFSDERGSNLFAEYGDRFQASRSFDGKDKAVKAYPVYLNLRNPLVIDHVDDLAPYLDKGQKFGVARGVSGNLPPEAITKLESMGYDGIITRETTAPRVHKTQGLKILARDDPKAVSFPVYVAFRPEQIKSAIGNRGTFDPNEPSIMHSNAAVARNSVADLLRAAMNGEAGYSQLMSAVEKQLLDAPEPTVREILGESARQRVNSVKRFYLDHISSGHNIARYSEGFRNVFDVLTRYTQRKNRLISDNLEVGLSRWLPWARSESGVTVKAEDIAAASQKLMQRTVKAMRKDSVEYQQLIGSMTDTQRELFDQAGAMIEKMLWAEFEAEKPGFAAAFKENPAEYAQWEKNRKQQIEKLIDEGYIPERRYGDHAAHVYTTTTDSKGQTKKVTLYYSLNEDEADARLEVNALTKELRDVADIKVEYGFRFKPEFDASLSYKQFIEMAEASGIKLEQAERERIAKSLIAADSTRRLRIFRRKNIPGYSEDGTRVLAEFVVNVSNKVAGAEFGDAVKEALRGRPVAVSVQNGVPQIQIDQQAASIWDKDGEQAGYFNSLAQRTVDFAMGPGENAPASRIMRAAAGFNFLGGSVATALVQLSSLPMNVVPNLMQHSNPGDAVSTMWGATQKALRHQKALRDLNTLRSNVELAGIDSDLRTALTRAGEDGTTLDTELYQLMGLTRGALAAKSRLKQKAVDVWMFPFRWSEQVNRISTFIAGWETGKKKGLAGEDLYSFAQKLVYDTQFRYDECVDVETEILTADGWKRYQDLSIGDSAFGVDDSGSVVATNIEKVNVFEGRKRVLRMSHGNGFEVVVTPQHDMLIQTYSSRDKKWQGIRKVEAGALKQSHHILRVPLGEALGREEVYSDDFVRLLAWVAAEGHYAKFRNCETRTNVRLCQSITHNPAYVDEIESILVSLGGHYRRFDGKARKHKSGRDHSLALFTLKKPISDRVREALPGKLVTAELVGKLTTRQMAIFLETFIKGDGHFADDRRGGGPTITQKSKVNLDALQMMATLSGVSSTLSQVNGCDFHRLYLATETKRTHVKALRIQECTVDTVWCPTTGTGNWIARRKGRVFVTGNSNRPAITRSPTWAILFTFKSYPIYMMEMVTALAKERPQAAVALLAGVAIAAGINGLPFAEDLMDIIDTIAQRLFNQPFNSKRAIRNWLKNASEAIAGADYSGLIMNGVVNEMTSLNFASRVGLGNLIPGTRLLAKDTDSAGQLEELTGPVGSMVTGWVKGAGSLLSGDPYAAAREAAPAGVKNLLKSGEQFKHGYAMDAKGQRIVDVTGWEAFAQALGFSSRALGLAYDLDRMDKQNAAFYKQMRQEMVGQIVSAIRSGDKEAIDNAVGVIAAWNSAHPEMMIAPDVSSLRRAIIQAQLPLNQRTLQLLPRHMRSQSISAEGIEE